MSSEKLRATKVGVAYVVEQKQEQNYDREEEAGVPQAVICWINAVLDGEHDKIPGGDWKSFCNHIKDGVMICKLINKLLKSDSKSPVPFQKKVMSPFVALTNIENFNNGCKAYGMPQESTFASVDLQEGRKAGFYNVLTTLHSLGFFANSKEFMPAYTGELSKCLDRE
ncbi:Calponin repeat [Mactra antiquata]